MFHCNSFSVCLSLTWCVQMGGWWICTSPFSVPAVSLAALLLVTLLTGDAFDYFYIFNICFGHNQFISSSLLLRHRAAILTKRGYWVFITCSLDYISHEPQSLFCHILEVILHNLVKRYYTL